MTCATRVTPVAAGPLREEAFMPVPFHPARRTRPAEVLLAIATATALGAPAPALAQTSSDTPSPRAAARPAPDATDPAAAVPALSYRSSLQTYRRHVEGPPRVWREANDEVLRIGGWRSYLREAQGAPAGGSDPTPASRPGSTPNSQANSQPASSPAAASPNVPGGAR